MRVAVLISGRGTNLQSLIDAAASDFPAEIALVVCNVAAAAGLERARRAGIPILVVDHREFDGREPFEEAMNEGLIRAGAELVCLAGFMRLLTDGFAGRWRDRLINVHPSLLPAFKGLNVHERVIETGVRVTGCTIHFVRPTMDDGPIIIQAAVPVRPDDDPTSLADRVRRQEHLIYPRAVRLIAEGRVRVVNERVLIEAAGSPDAVLVNPE